MTDYSSMSNEELSALTGMQPPAIHGEATTASDPLDASVYMPKLFNKESGNKQNVIGDGGAAIGKGQLHSAAAIDAGIDPNQRYNEKDNEAASQKYLQQQMDKYKDPYLGLLAYNWGPGNVDKWRAAGSDPAAIPPVHATYPSDVSGGKVTAPLNPESNNLYAQNDTPVSDAATDTKKDYSKMSNEELAALTGMKPQQNQATATAQQPPAMDIQKGSMLDSIKGDLAKIGASPPGQMVGNAIDSAQDIMGNIYGAATGNNYKEVTPTPDLDTLRQKGFHDTSWPQLAGAAEESLFNSPPGQMLRLVGASPQGAAFGSGLSKTNEGLENLGVPHQYSQALEMAAPLIGKSASISPADISTVADNTTQGMRAALNNMAIIKDQSSGSPMPDLSSFLSNNESKAGPFRNITKNITNPIGFKADNGELPPINPSLQVGAGGKPISVNPQAMAAAQSTLKQTLNEAGIDPSKVAEKLEEMKKSGLPVTALDAIIDAYGDTGRDRPIIALAKATANMPGEGAALAGEASSRGRTASQRISDAFSEALSDTPYYDMKNDAIAQMKKSGEFYGPAFKANKSINDPEINAILNTPSGNTALKNAILEMRDARTTVGVNDPDLVEQATLTGQDIPPGGIANGLKMKTIDLAKQHLWQMADQFYRTGDKSRAAALKQQYAQINDRLDELDSTNKTKLAIGENGMERQIVPGSGLYAQARKAYSTPARVAQNLEQGREYKSLDPEQIQEKFANPDTSDAEKSAFSTGLVRNLKDDFARSTTDNLNNGINPINKVWNDTVRDRVKPLFNDNDHFNNFDRNMKIEQVMAKANNAYHPGSTTAPNLNYAGNVMQQAIQNSGKVVKAMTNPLGSAMDFGLGIASKTLQKQIANINKESAAGIIRHLTTDDPEVWKALAPKP